MKNNILRKSLIFSIIFMLIGVSIIPNISSNIEKSIRTRDSLSKEFLTKENFENSDLVTFKIYHIKNDKSFEKITKKLLVDEAQDLIDKLNQTLSLDSTVNEIFEQSFDLLDEYGLTTSNLTLNDILDVNLLNGPFKVVEDQNFAANFSPILIVGGGFGFGIGEQFRPFNTLLHFLAILGGLAWVYCIDPGERVFYKLRSFLIPILIGYLSAFTGLIMFAISPGVLYSNIVALGFTPRTVWVQFPPP